MQKKKALIVATVASMIDQFNMPNIRLLIDLGYEVHVACNFVDLGNITQERGASLIKELDALNVVQIQVDFHRNPFNLIRTIKAYTQLKKLMGNNYTLIHSHSPVGGVLGRLAANKYRKKGLISIYTAHGFHFHKHSSIFSWLVFYPIEYIMSYLTDVLITINQEDYLLAKKRFHANEIVKINSIGLNLYKYYQFDKIKQKEIRIENQFEVEDFIIVSVGELNDNKNHITIIKSLNQLYLNYGITDFKYLIFGKGNKRDFLEEEIKKLGLQNNIFLKGPTEDVNSMLNIADIFAFPSKREGLGMAALEAMAVGLPIVTSNVHGIVDYSQNGITGLTCAPDDVDCFANAFLTLYKSNSMRENMRENNKEQVKKYSLDSVLKKMECVYLKK